MDHFTWLDHILNVCRSVSDVLHILTYLLFVTIAIIIAIYRFDKSIVMKHIIAPFLFYLVKKKQGKLVRIKPKHRALEVGNYTYRFVWTPTSTRIPYIVKLIKSFFNRKK